MELYRITHSRNSKKEKRTHILIVMSTVSIVWASAARSCVPLNRASSCTYAAVCKPLISLVWINLFITDISVCWQEIRNYLEKKKEAKSYRKETINNEFTGSSAFCKLHIHFRQRLLDPLYNSYYNYGNWNGCKNYILLSLYINSDLSIH